MPKIANNLKRLEGQPMFNILLRCRELEKKGKKIKHFELGDPDFESPKKVVESAINSLGNGNTHYQPSRGDLNFINSIRDTTLISRGFKPLKNQVSVTTGANAGIFYTLRSICDYGEEIILPNPYFPTYKSAAEIAGINCKYYDLTIENQFQPCLTQIEKKINQKTKAILINSPSNPMGSIIKKETLQSIYKLAALKDIYIISDEVYSRMFFNNEYKFFSLSEMDECKERVILINGFSKAFAMTGWRVGTVIAPIDVSDKITLLSESIASCVPGFVQDGANTAIRLSSSITEIMYHAFRKRQLMFLNEFKNVAAIDCLLPDGAMYVFPSIKKITNDSENFAFHLLDNYGIACVPGVYFGEQGEGHLRFSCAGNQKEIKGIAKSINQAIISFNSSKK